MHCSGLRSSVVNSVSALWLLVSGLNGLPGRSKHAQRPGEPIKIKNSHRPPSRKTAVNDSTTFSVFNLPPTAIWLSVRRNVTFLPFLSSPGGKKWWVLRTRPESLTDFIKVSQSFPEAQLGSTSGSAYSLDSHSARALRLFFLPFFLSEREWKEASISVLSTEGPNRFPSSCHTDSLHLGRVKATARTEKKWVRIKKQKACGRGKEDRDEQHRALVEFEPFGKCLGLGDVLREHEKMFFMVLYFKCFVPECTLSGTKPAAYVHQNSSFSKHRKLICWTQFESIESKVSSAIPKWGTVCVCHGYIHQITPNEKFDL